MLYQTIRHYNPPPQTLCSLSPLWTLKASSQILRNSAGWRVVSHRRPLLSDSYYTPGAQNDGKLSNDRQTDNTWHPAAAANQTGSLPNLHSTLNNIPAQMPQESLPRSEHSVTSSSKSIPSRGNIAVCCEIKQNAWIHRLCSRAKRKCVGMDRCCARQFSSHGVLSHWQRASAGDFLTLLTAVSECLSMPSDKAVVLTDKIKWTQ